jgi:hypothetical protein
MAYRPDPVAFGPPLLVWLPSLAYVVIAAIVGALVLVAQQLPSTSPLFLFFYEHESQRLIGARPMALMLALGAFGAVLRTSMRGVRVRPDGVELRDVNYFIPRVKRYAWAQIDCIVLDQPSSVALDLWDGSRAFLPTVSDRSALSRVLEKIGYMRAIPVRGGQGLDELPDQDDADDLAA